jgi:hypothetical protein
VQMAITGDDSEALLSLHEWLMNDVDVVRSAAVGLRSMPKPGDMGAVEIISVVLSTSIGLASFAVSFATWRRTRSEPRITVQTRDVYLTFSIESGEEARQIVETFSEMLEEGTPEDGDE